MRSLKIPKILVLIELEIFYKIKPTAKIRDDETGLVACDFHDFNLTKYFYETHETEAKTYILILFSI